MGRSTDGFLHTTETAQPGPATSLYVQRYIQRRAQIPGESLSQPIPARVEQVIAFQFGDPCFLQRSQQVVKTPTVTIAGPQTIGRSSLLLTGNMDSFYIFLRAAGLRALFGIPLAELSDRSYPAHAVLGNPVTELYEQLAEASTFHERVQLAERFLARRIMKVARHPTDGIIERIMSANGVVSIRELAIDFSLNARQLERTFVREVGMSPKVFARVVRFQAALTHKGQSPATTWASTAQEFNFHDQMHMTREFRKLSGESPGRLLTRLAFLG